MIAPEDVNAVTAVIPSPLSLKDMQEVFDEPDVVSALLVMNLGGCDRRVLRDRGELLNYTDLLVEKIDMRTHGKPVLERFGEGDLGGETVIRMITTSNIVVHAYEFREAARVVLDSCKAYSIADVLAFTRQAFGTERLTYSVDIFRIP